MENVEMHIKDPKLNATTTGLNDDDLDLNFPHIKTPEPITPSPNTSNPPTPLDYGDNALSVIEQFQLNHNMQISNDNIELAKDIENLNNLESQVMETASNNILPLNTNHNDGNQQKSLLKTSVTNSSPPTYTEDVLAKPCNIVINPTNHSTNQVPVQKSIVLKQGPVKIIKLATPIKKLPVVDQNNKIIQISKINPNKIIVLKSNHSDATAKVSLAPVNVTKTVPTLPALSYESWLDHIIEILNDSISIQDTPIVKNTFNVPEAIFNNFSKSFALNNKRRLPNTTSAIKTGKYKDHIKYTWYLNQASTVQRIFTSKNVSFLTFFLNKFQIF